MNGAVGPRRRRVRYGNTSPREIRRTFVRIGP